MPLLGEEPWLVMNPFYLLGEQIVGRAMNYAEAFKKSKQLKENPDAVAVKLLAEYLSI